MHDNNTAYSQTPDTILFGFAAPTKRYAIVGTGSRSHMFSSALLGSHKDHGKLVALCDLNQQRMDFYNKQFIANHDIQALPTYLPNDFERMIAEQQVDTVIVTTIDRTHHTYITRAMQAGCDVITEKADDD